MALFAALDRCEALLGERRYIAGDHFTEADVRLFVTLIRFDPIYAVYFKTNKQLIREYPNLREYVKQIFNMEGVANVTNLTHCKTHYFTSHPKLNWRGLCFSPQPSLRAASVGRAAFWRGRALPSKALSFACWKAPSPSRPLLSVPRAACTSACATAGQRACRYGIIPNPSEVEWWKEPSSRVAS